MVAKTGILTWLNVITVGSDLNKCEFFMFQSKKWVAVGCSIYSCFQSS